MRTGGKLVNHLKAQRREETCPKSHSKCVKMMGEEVMILSVYSNFFVITLCYEHIMRNVTLNTQDLAMGLASVGAP